MKIEVLNLDQIQKYYPEEPYIAISIRNVNSNLPYLPTTQYTKGILHLMFQDIDPTIIDKELIKNYNLRPILEYQANHIINFILSYQNEVNLILCQCETGISRSAGVAGAIAKILKEDDQYFFDHYLPNRYVYKLILNIYERKIYNEK